MNIARRGTKQEESIVFRCTQQDKAAIRLEADSAGLSMSDLIKQLLIKEKIIEAKYPTW